MNEPPPSPENPLTAVSRAAASGRSAGPVLALPHNPAYGTGTTRRRIELLGRAGRVDARMADNFHEMACTVTHDGERVTKVDGAMLRFPTTACPGAVAQLDRLVGCSIEVSRAQLYAGGQARQNCTHLFDLAVMALGHAPRGPSAVVYDAVVPDDQNGIAHVEVVRNGQAVHQWSIRDGLIAAPTHLAGRPIGSGFGPWARDCFTGDELEAALVLARVCYLAVGRRYRTRPLLGHSIARNKALIGACYAYAPERIGNALFRDSVSE